MPNRSADVVIPENSIGGIGKKSYVSPETAGVSESGGKFTSKKPVGPAGVLMAMTGP